MAGGEPDAHPLLVALVPVADALGATIVARDGLEASDVPLVWDGLLVGGLRLAEPRVAMSRLLDSVERELGGRLGQLSREDKQRAVRMLDDRGAFTLRRSVEEVADALGVSRITVYNYLNAIREPSTPSP